MKTASIFVLSGIATMLLVAACSSADFTGGPPPTATWDDVVKTRVAQRNEQPTRTPIPTSTPFARRTPTLIGTAAPTSTPQPTPTPMPTPTPNPLSAELSPVLLALDDLPTGWKISQEGLEVELTRTQDVCGSTIQDPAVADLVASYEESLLGPFAAQSLSLYDGSGNAAAVFEQLRSAYSSCPETGYNYSDGSWMLISPISFPQVGEESFAFRLTVGLDDLAVEADMVVVRIGKVLTMITYADFGGLLGNSGDRSQFETLVRSAEAKIHAMAEYIDAIEAPVQLI